MRKKEHAWREGPTETDPLVVNTDKGITEEKKKDQSVLIKGTNYSDVLILSKFLPSPSTLSPLINSLLKKS